MEYNSRYDVNDIHAISSDLNENSHLILKEGKRSKFTIENFANNEQVVPLGDSEDNLKNNSQNMDKTRTDSRKRSRNRAHDRKRKHKTKDRYRKHKGEPCNTVIELNLFKEPKQESLDGPMHSQKEAGLDFRKLEIVKEPTEVTEKGYLTPSQYKKELQRKKTRQKNKSPVEESNCKESLRIKHDKGDTKKEKNLLNESFEGESDTPIVRSRSVPRKARSKSPKQNVRPLNERFESGSDAKKHSSRSFERKTRSKSPKQNIDNSVRNTKVDRYDKETLDTEKETLNHPQFIRKHPTSPKHKKLQSTNAYRVLRDNFSTFERIPELHFLGEICGATGFNYQHRFISVSCKWSIDWGNSWSFIAGEYSGQTQYCSKSSLSHADERVVWNHPIDVHFASISIAGWPRLILEVWGLDELGRTIFLGYGFTHLPNNAGAHKLVVHCWRPIGTLAQELRAFFLGVNPLICDEAISFAQAWNMRSHMVTATTGEIYVNLYSVHRYFKEQLMDSEY